MNMRRITILCALLWTLPLFPQPRHFTYPPAAKVDITDNYHGTIVADPYRWMEDEQSPDLKKWIEAENELTSGFLKDFAPRERLRDRITGLWNYPRSTVPSHEGSRYFFWKNNGLQNQSVLFMQEALDAEPVMILDPNTLSSDGTVAVSFTSFSHDGSMMAFALARSGSDWQEIMVRDLNSGKDYPEVLKRCKFSSVAWHHNKTGFFYNRYPDEGTVAKEEEITHNTLYWHTLGTPQTSDKLVYELPDEKEFTLSPDVTEDGEWLIVTLWNGTDPRNRIHVRRIDGTGPFVRLLDAFDASYSILGNDGDLFYVQTDFNAPRMRIVAVGLSFPERPNWKELIPESNDVLSNAGIINNSFVALYLKDARHDLKVFALDGSPLHTIELPAIGSVSGLSGKRSDTTMFFGFSSFVYPTTIYRYDFPSKTTALFRASEAKVDPSKFETRQIFYSSKDGTRIPMFITGLKGIALDGTNPVLMYGYGGFNTNMTPGFLPWRIAWLENGGVYAVPNIRGGGEYGEEWHRAGILERKQNVFDDFIAAGEWLIANKYTSSSRLSIMGASNGGLLTAACMLQRPELFGAVICQVPVTDMLRYHRFTVGRFWVSDFGNAEERPEDFRFLYAYSPLHNVRAGVTCPPTLITTADHDDRVVPAHAMKFAAALQANDAGTNPILLRVETKAGHGSGKPVSKQIEEMTDILSFLAKTFAMTIH